jgi:hypothetical protein
MQQSDSAAALLLLNEAVQLSRSFSISERAEVLIDAGDVAARIDAQSANTWSTGAFALSKDMPLGQSRAATQKNALRTLALNAPDEALVLYRKQDLPSKWGKPSEMSEDPRALSDPSVLTAIWKSKGEQYIRQLISLADYLGKTGQYPYRAMGEVATDAARSNPRAAKTILAGALHAFRRDPGFKTTNNQFVLFILRTHTIASPRILKKEVESAVDAIEHPRTQNQAHATYHFTVTTSLGNAQFDSEREYLLFRLMPLARDFAPRLAARLRATYSSFQHAPTINADTPVQVAGAVSIDGTASPARMQIAVDKSLVFRVSQLAQGEPDQALRLTNQIADPALRTLALVLLAPAEKDEQQAKQWMLNGNEALSTMGDNVLKLRLMTAIIKSDLSMGETKSARIMLPTAFALGQRMYSADQQQHPDKPAYLTDGADSLAEIAYAAGLINGETAEALIRHVPDDILRARLLISTARALAGMKNRLYLPV